MSDLQILFNSYLATGNVDSDEMGGSAVVHMESYSGGYSQASQPGRRDRVSRCLC